MQRVLLDISHVFNFFRGSFASSWSVKSAADESALYVTWQEQGICADVQVTLAPGRPLNSNVL